MMFSRFQYPSFKALNWKTKKSIPRFLVIILVLIFTGLNYEWMPAVLFLAYLLYGVLRSWLSREWRREIEEEIGEEPSEEGNRTSAVNVGSSMYGNRRGCQTRVCQAWRLSLQRLIQLRQNFRIADVRPFTVQFKRLHFLARMRQVDGLRL